jgi:multidrug resistance efflux pump
MAQATTPPSKSRRWWILAIALVLVSLGGFAQFMNFTLRGQPDDSDSADRSANRYVVCYGFVDLKSGVTRMHSTHPGRVADVPVAEGDAVSADAVLVQLVDDVPRAQLEQARCELDDAKRALSEGRTQIPEKHRLALLNQSAAVSIAQRNREARDIAYRRKKDLAANPGGLASPADVDVAKQELEAAQTQVQVEVNQLKMLELRDPKSDIRRLEVQVEKLTALVKQAEAVLSEYTLRAPRAGSVLRVFCSPGDLLVPQSPQPAIEFAIEGPRFVRAEVEQSFASSIVTGLRATMNDDTNAPGSWTGHVVRVGDWYTHKRNVINDPTQVNDVRTLECLIALDSGQPPLKINQRMRVRVDLPQR